MLNITQSITKWYQLKFFSEENLFRTSDDLAVQIRSRRQRSMPIFEDEAIFKDHVRRWINTQVRDSVDNMLNPIVEMIRGDALEATSDKKYFELALYNGLRVGIEEAIKLSCEAWLKNLKRKIEIFLRQEMEPSTQNHYFTTTILKLRTAYMKELILSAAQNGAENNNNGALVVPVSHIKNVFDNLGQNKDIIEFVANELSISLRAYYKVARKNVVDGIAKIVDHSLEAASSSSSYFSFATRSRDANDDDDDDGNNRSAAHDLSSFPEIVESYLNNIEYDSLLRNHDTEMKRARAVRAVKGLKDTLKELPALRAKLAM